MLDEDDVRSFGTFASVAIVTALVSALFALVFFVAWLAAH
jgi:hypothetical protein